MATTRIGPYVLQIVGDRLSVSRPTCWLIRLGGRERRPILSLVGFSKVAAVDVSQRRRSGPEMKRPWMARSWEVRVLGDAGQPLSRGFRFRFAAEAERFASEIRSFAGASGL